MPCLVAAPEPTSGVRLAGVGLSLCSLADCVTDSLWRPARALTTGQVPPVQYWVPELLCRCHGGTCLNVLVTDSLWSFLWVFLGLFILSNYNRVLPE